MKEERQENEEPEPAGETPSTVPCTDRWEVRILLVDDEEIVMRKTAAALERLGYAVAGATDGQAAQRLLAEAPEAYDLLITDVNMPRMDGWELARRARQAGFCGPILMISGRPQRIMSDPDGEPLADGWLSKPFTREALEAQVCALLELR